MSTFSLTEQDRTGVILLKAPIIYMCLFFKTQKQVICRNRAIWHDPQTFCKQLFTAQGGACLLVRKRLTNELTEFISIISSKNDAINVCTQPHHQPLILSSAAFKGARWGKKKQNAPK